MSNIHEECGVFGVFSPDNYDVARMTYYGLFSLQHRGQESCGIVVNDDGLFAAYKDVGLVNDVFTPDRLDALGPGSIAVGHVRYGTTGSNDRNNAQPIVVNHVKGRMALAHNGNLVNSYELRSKLEARGLDLPHDERHRGHLLHHYEGAPDIRLDRGGRQPRDGQAEGRLFARHHVPLEAHRRPR